MADLSLLSGGIQSVIPVGHATQSLHEQLCLRSIDKAYSTDKS